MKWSLEKRAQKTEEIRKEASRTAKRLGAYSCLMVVFYADGPELHMLDAGTAPMPPEEVYRKVLSAYEITRENGGADTALN